MTEPIYNILFLCTGNSARSILSEAITNHRHGKRFHAYSAGSHPTGRVNPHAVQLLQRLGVSTEGLRSKSWDEFAAPGAPPLHFVFTVCDNAAGEACPVWPGQPMTAHWGVPDPAAAEGAESDRDRAFAQALHVLEHRINLFAALPLATLDRLALGQKLHDIGRS
jgi:arsenate reductase (thioredoxin)